VIGLTREDLVRTVQLLEQHHPSELVGQRQRAEREAMLDRVELEPERPADHEGQIATGGATLLEEPAEADAVIGLAAVGEQRHEGPRGQSSPDVLFRAQLDLLQPGVAGQQLAIVRDVVDVRSTQPTDRYDEQTQGLDFRTRSTSGPGILGR